MISIATIVEPTGVLNNIETIIPSSEVITEYIAALIVTALKLLKTCIDDKAGNITSADISIEPTKFIASTIITAITIAIIKLYKSTFTPIALEKFSSNVIENNLL